MADQLVQAQNLHLRTENHELKTENMALRMEVGRLKRLTDFQLETIQKRDVAIQELQSGRAAGGGEDFTAELQQALEDAHKEIGQLKAGPDPSLVEMLYARIAELERNQANPQVVERLTADNDRLREVVRATHAMTGALLADEDARMMEAMSLGKEVARPGPSAPRGFARLSISDGSEFTMGSLFESAPVAAPKSKPEAQARPSDAYKPDPRLQHRAPAAGNREYWSSSSSVADRLKSIPKIERDY